jgi:methionyl-tRNA formyltransferase
MRLIFLGTPEFAVPSLDRLAVAGHDLAAVVTRPDRPKGRGREIAAPPVKHAAQRLNLPVHQPERIRTPEFIGFLRGLRPEALVVVGYGRIIPQAILDIPPQGILNVHASLLPKYRGAAPIQWAIAMGETRTGVTTMRIDAGLDTGDILLQAETEIGDQETAIELGKRLAPMGAALLIETLDRVQRGALAPIPQDHAQATLAPMLRKEDGLIDWSRPAREIHNRVRGFVPWPGCYTLFRGGLLHVWRTRLAQASAVRTRLAVTCGDGAVLELLEVQPEGKKRMTGTAFLNGYRVGDNELLEMSR